MKRGELTMTYETLLEELQGLNPNQLKYAINDPNVKPNQPYLSF